MINRLNINITHLQRGKQSDEKFHVEFSDKKIKLKCEINYSVYYSV